MPTPATQRLPLINDHGEAGTQAAGDKRTSQTANPSSQTTPPKHAAEKPTAMSTRAMPFRGSFTSREQVAVYEFSWLATRPDSAGCDFHPGVFMPTKIRWLPIIDLPMMVVIFFAVARRNPVSGCVTGAIIGLMQDVLGGPHIPSGCTASPTPSSDTWHRRSG